MKIEGRFLKPIFDRKQSKDKIHAFILQSITTFLELKYLVYGEGEERLDRLCVQKTYGVS